MMARICLGGKMDIEIQEVQRIPPRGNLNRYTLRHMLINLSKARNKERMFIQQEKSDMTHA